ALSEHKTLSISWSHYRDPEITTFEETLDDLLLRRRSLARDMLCATPDLSGADFEDILKGALD
ncbi:TPA: hypothetical protein ACNV5S_005428, partial [Citrobacter braakii]